ncbi:response regulator transcription factor [Ramlibacter sp. G-1-2-2]|uniref:Response regulator transcription factor n=1 Tax=Ramlibacter agri TaxID=2728837 RepID=A0A848H4S4_9BURK|nr:response regulator [Ramlibacter agri]NML44531.1 response regulator transcription factor [Ramlibacter agri]
MTRLAEQRQEAGGPSRKVHVVDDDPMVLAAIARLLRLHDFDVAIHAGAQAFLDAYDPAQTCCALVDVAMPGMDGLALQALLLQRDGPPLVFLSGFADVATCAAAMRHGAVDFLKKPVDEAMLVAALERALQRDAQMRERRAERSDAERRLATLTAREFEVLQHVMSGRLNKQIAYDLDIAEKTVKVHRARAMEKMGVQSVAAVVQLVERWLADAVRARGKQPG